MTYYPPHHISLYYIINAINVNPLNYSSALTINGLAPRGNPILGLSRFRENSTQTPYTTLIYGNGPGHHQPRRDPSVGPNSTDYPYYVQYAAIHQEEAFHDGSYVAVFASGPFGHLFQGVQEQSYIAHVFAYSMCIGNYTNQPHCKESSNDISRADRVICPSGRSTVVVSPPLGRQAYNLNPSVASGTQNITMDCLMLVMMLISSVMVLSMTLKADRNVIKLALRDNQ